MRFLAKLFGQKPPAAATPERADTEPPGEDELMRVFNAYGREMMISKQDWRDNVLLDGLESARHDPDQLYSMLVNALEDGLAKDVVQYAEHLQRISHAVKPQADPSASRHGVPRQSRAAAKGETSPATGAPTS
ncbi:MAG: hypothetical protein WD894_01025 [Pirellulales bacterium]